MTNVFKNTLLLSLLLSLIQVQLSWATQDTYIGDTAIYGGSTASLNPNVLIIFDSSGSMGNTVAIENCNEDTDSSGAYDNSTDYTSKTSDQYCSSENDKGSKNSGGSQTTSCSQDTIYSCSDKNWEKNGYCSTWTAVGNLSTSSISCSSSSIKTTLAESGYYIGNTSLQNTGQCSSSSSSNYYATGNYIVWYNLTSSGSTTTTTTSGSCTTTYEKKIDIAHDVITDLIENTEGVNFGVMKFNGSNGGKFITQTIDGTSKEYTSTIADMDEIFSGSVTNRDALNEIVNDIQASGVTPLGESLFEALTYFQGKTGAFTSVSYTSPITASCQTNYVIVITDGMANQDSSTYNKLSSLCTNADCDGDSNSRDSSDDGLDDVAYYMYHNDLSSTYSGTQNAITYTIGFDLSGSDADAVQLLEDTADNGGGIYYSADDYSSLSTALTAILSTVLDQNSAFVAPVIPSNPENRSYSGDRIYFGLFKPVTDGDWIGNLKKFGMDSDGNIIDANGDAATDEDGSFLDSALSYWGSDTDGGNVDEGGAGQLLADRDLDSNPRAIYTYTGTTTDLTDSSNAFSVDNEVLTYSDFDVDDDDDKTQIINYILGYDSFDEDSDSDTEEQRSWPLADILHSGPAVQIYQNFDSDDEADTSKNKSIIYVGSNDGQMHAFRDADGEELWSFIPPEQLPYLQDLPDNNVHEYFSDGSPVLLVYDYDKDGNIGPDPETSSDDSDTYGTTDSGTKDRVILIYGARRGGGTNTLSSEESRGDYYALDVTDPENPEYLWSLNNTTTDTDGTTLLYSELGETWSQPVLGKIRMDGVTRIVAFIGAGYDNNEDLRYGDTQTFPEDTTESTDTTASSSDAGEITSGGTASQMNPKGRGIYVIELAQYDTSTNIPSFHSAPVKLWEYVYDSDRSDNNPEFSFPTQVVARDTDYDGYIDRLYAGDTGGQMWRFNVGNKTSTDNWSGQIIFSANPSDSSNSEDGSYETNGRKILYPPAVVYESNYTALYFGSGDRPHPLNQDVVDRLYAFYDRNSDTTETEASMVNVTDYPTIDTSSDTSTSSTCTLSSSSATCVLENLYNSSYFGWFIKLDENIGEKVLASPTVYNSVVYFTSFVPELDSDDPCLSGNLGVSMIYALNYLTGEATIDLDDDGDLERSTTVGTGIASGLVVNVSSDGSTAVVGTSDGATTFDLGTVGSTKQLYWLME